MFKVVAFEDRLEREKGMPCLFALVQLRGYPWAWEVYVSASWAEGDLDAARRYITGELVSWLGPEERSRVMGVEVLRTCDPFVCALLDRVKGSELLRELRAVVIGDVEIERALIINSCCAE